jgi:bifunctional DNA-binding transcriptional regulator/antitoxin component of YhaV-PrlF toxin-antitoxin module
MKVCRLKIDTKGRVQLPKSFLDANNIKVGQTGYVEIISNNSSAVRFTFDHHEHINYQGD